MFQRIERGRLRRLLVFKVSDGKRSIQNSSEEQASPDAPRLDEWPFRIGDAPLLRLLTLYVPIAATVQSRDAGHASSSGANRMGS